MVLEELHRQSEEIVEADEVFCLKGFAEAFQVALLSGVYTPAYVLPPLRGSFGPVALAPSPPGERVGVRGLFRDLSRRSV